MTWYKQKEKEGAQITGSRLHFSSGRGYEKHDYSNSEYLTEHKSVQGPKYVVRAKEVWNPLGRRAFKQGKKPRLVICFTPAPGVERWVEVLGPYQIQRGAAVWYDRRTRSPELKVFDLDTSRSVVYNEREVLRRSEKEVREGEKRRNRGTVGGKRGK